MSARYACVSFLLLAACGSDAGETGEPERTPPEKMPLEDGPGAFDPDFETSAAFFSRTDGLVTSLPESPHTLVRIFYSRNVEPIIDDTAFEAPVGTVAIKQQDRDQDGSIDNVLAMIKRPAGFDSENGDWLYEQRSAAGSLEVSGKTPFCIDCHRDFAATDYLGGTTLKDR